MEGGPKLEAKFLKLGKELSSFPPENDLFAHLEEIDGLLTNVEQSPSRTMLNALQPLTKALAAKELLRHSDMDVKVAVASCISEITRITAPETPYDDNIMKEIFQLIVGSFAGLDNTSSRSYKKRISILETVAKVRSCVVMLDLECDDLILEMFHQFVKRIRDENSESVFSCMETIMTLVIEESEDVPIELLSVLLYALKNDKEVLPIARHLAEHVLNNCASRIRPPLVDLVRTIGAPLNEYHKIVESICRDNSNVLDKQEETKDEVKISTEEEDAGFPENVVVHASISNGSVQNGIGDAVDCPSSPMHSLGNEKSENFISDNSGCDNLESNTKNSDDTEKDVQLLTNTEDCPQEFGFPKVNEISTTINQHSVSIGSEKKNKASIIVQAPITELETPISLETKQQNVSNITTVQKDPNVSQTNGNTNAVAHPTTSAYVQKESFSDILRRDDVTNSKNDASESSKGDNVEAATTVNSDYASKPKQSIFKRGRKGKKGRFLKGKKFVSAEKVSVQKERGTPVKICSSNANEVENKFEKADDVETPKNTVNKSDMVSKTIGKRGRPRKELALEKEKDPADQILQQSVEKERDTSVVISPSKSDYSEKKPEVTNDVKAHIGKRGRPRKEHAVEKEKDTADQVLQEIVEKEIDTSAVTSPSKGDYSEKKPEIADDVKAQISAKELVMASKSSGKRGRPRKKHATGLRKKHATGKDKGPTDTALPVKCDANVKESSALDNVEAPKSLNYEKSKLKSRSKRGRPKKKDATEIKNVPLDEILLSGSNTSEHMHIIKCKGSRTKVKDAAAKNNEPLHEDFSLKGDKTEVPENIDDIESPNGLTNDSYITPKGRGKKGRPKKASALEKESSLPNAVLPFKNGSAEDPENIETPAKSTDLDVISKTKGKRGRPKKEPVTQESPVINKPSAKKHKGDRLETDVDIGSTLQETASALKSALKSQSADKANLDSCYEPRSRRKRATNTDDIYVKTPEPKRTLDDRLVGSKIKVWWPDDKEFYEGVVDSYDRDTKKHKIAYADGDEEVLLLKDERWEYVGDKDMSQTKKAKTDSTSKQAKSEEQSKSMAEPSSKDTPRPRGRPRKETYSQKADISPDNISPESMKQPKEKPSSDEKIRAIKILSKLKDEDNSPTPSCSGRSKAKKKGTPVSGTKLKVTFSKSQPKNETESTPLVKDPK